MGLRLVPCRQAHAHAFVRHHHRHHKPSVGAIFCLACADDLGIVRGVAVVGRPVARRSDDLWSLEITRIATDGCRNACSFLLGACRKVGFSLGYRRLITYTLPAEGGASLRASGWTEDGITMGGSWSCTSRPRIDKHPLGQKSRWIVSRKDNPPPFDVVVWPADEDSAHPGLFDG